MLSEIGQTSGPLPFARAMGLAYATVGFVLTHLTFGLLILFLLGWLPYSSIDGTPTVGLAASFAIDLALVGLFGLQHSGMARTAIKRISAHILPEPLERATYVYCANAALLFLILAWQPVPTTVWRIDATLPVVAIWTVFVVGWGLSFAGSMLIDHLQLLGMPQAWAWSNGRVHRIKPFQNHWLYDLVRHPIQLGLIMAFWATPHMTVGHMLFSAGLTLYIVIGTRFEEKDLIGTFGEDYAAYRARVPGLIPRFRRSR